MTGTGSTRPTTRGEQRARLILDLSTALVIVAAITTFSVMTGSLVLPLPWLVLVGLWTAVWATAALPALAVLHLSPPRVPLSERSALVSSARWFGRAVWATVLFSISIVLGTAAGIVATKISETEQDAGVALQLVFEGMASIAVGPVLTIVALAYIVMSVRWLSDLTVISDRGGARDVWNQLELRWFGASPTTAGRVDLRSPAAWFSATCIGRAGLVVTLITVAADIAVTWAVIADQ